MEISYQESHAYKPIMAGLFAGIFATILSMIFDVVYRNITGFSLSAIINVASIIFAVLLVLVIAGSIYAVMDRYIKRGSLFYIVLFAILTSLCIRMALHVVRSDDPGQVAGFRGLFLGIVIITGVAATIFVPYLTKHDSIFS